LLLAATLLWVEGSRRRNPWRSVIGVGVPLAMLLLAFPGDRLSESQTFYCSLLQSAAGSPVQLCGWLVTAYFAYLWFRGVPGAEGGLVLVLAALSWIDRST